ncbi:MAG: histidine--tRNA ligase [Deltaproteobacteria bacterium]|nr:histidine--tRNA ligase [Deltaproteobacteria bacterium]
MVKALKGFKDILPDEANLWQDVERVARQIFHRFGYREIRVPILEKTGLFARSIGETTDIVEKEMYSFTDRNGDSLTMRPEGTAPVLRAFIEHNLQAERPVQKLYTMGPMFRHERPQKGRLRQFHQMSVEAIGADQPEIDAEIMAMASMVISELGLDVSLEINSLGCPKCRPAFNQALLDFLAENAGSLCPDCERRRYKNPLRVLDCKNKTCQARYVNAPSIQAHLCPECAAHFQAVESYLKALDIRYKVNPFMVRGLDYYTRTTFELLTNALGAQSAVGAGGRYDGLIEQLGGPALPGIGFAMGLERLTLLLAAQQRKSSQRIDIFIAALGGAALERGVLLAHALRQRGVAVVMDYAGRSLKSQMKQAARHDSRFTLIIGENELAGGQAVMRDMESHEQVDVILSEDLATWSTALAKKILA